MILQITKQHNTGSQTKSQPKLRLQNGLKSTRRNDHLFYMFQILCIIKQNSKILNLYQKKEPQPQIKDKLNKNMSIYSSFFTPQTISILLCLHESTKQVQQVDPKSPIIQFLIKKILKLTQEASIQITNQGFEAEMFSVINDIDFLEQYRDNLSQIDSFNNFYRQISNILKTLRSLRSSKLEQGNVVDFLVRRLYIYFEKLDFKEIVNIYENFNAYRQGLPFKMRQNQFTLTKSVEQVKFNLENYQIKQNPQEINKIIQLLSETDHTFKTSYIKGLYKSELKKPNESMDQLHRYFDRSLGNLFQQKTQNVPMSNKINHCIISTAYSSLKMGHLEQCLQSISEGLRISQNNSDQQSINNCIIYLYKIAQQLGKYQEEILLAEHAITHSLNLSNILLMVYSCLCYSAFQKKYNCQNTQVTLLKSRHIHWTDGLHFSKKKIYSNFESNCKNIYHSFRSLLIPTFLHKLAILIHIPQLRNLLINPFYSRKELFDLEVYKQFEGNNHVIDKELKRAKRYFNMNQKILLNKSLERLYKLEKSANSPENVVKVKKFLCYLKLQNGVQMDCYKSIEQLLLICRKYGFVKSHMVQALNYINKLLLKNELLYDSLVKIEQTIKFCDQNALNEQKTISVLLKAQALTQLQSLMEALELVQSIEQEGFIEKLQPQNLSLFWQTKFLVSKKVIQSIESDINFLNQANELKKNQFLCLQNLLKCYFKEGNMEKIKRILKEQQDFIIMNPLIVAEKDLLQQKIKKILAYIQKVEQVYRNIQLNPSEEEQFDEQSVHRKVMVKIECLFLG